MMYVNIMSISAVCIAVAFSGWEGEHAELMSHLQASNLQKRQDERIPLRYQKLYSPVSPWIAVFNTLEVYYRQVKELIPQSPVLQYNRLNVWESLEVWMNYAQSILELAEQAEKSIVVLLTHGPIVLYYIVKLYTCKVGKIYREETTVRTSDNAGVQKQEEARHIYPRIKPLSNRNKQLEFDLDQKVRELDVMARKVYHLQRQSQLQERDISQKDRDIDEMALTIEYLQRPSSKRWSDVLDKVYKINCSAPQLITGEYVYLPMVTEIELNASVSRGSDGESDSDGVIETEGDADLVWDECG